MYFYLKNYADLYGLLLYRNKEVHSRPYYQDFFWGFNVRTREGVLGQAEYDTCSGLKTDHGYYAALQ